MHEFTTRRKVEFADTDMAGIVHFARYAVFMETAEHEFLDALGTSVHLEIDGMKIGWPRVRVALEYKNPARFGDVLEINLRVLRKGRTSMTYGFRFARDGGEEVATGEATSVCCAVGDNGKLRAIPIPGLIADRVEEAPR